MRGIKICEYCKKEFSPIRRNGEVYGIKQFNGLRFCSRKCSKTGIKESEETKRKIGLKSIGRKATLGKHWKLSEESKRKMSEAKKGEKSYLWKGGISKTYLYKHITDFKYKLWRSKVYARDNWTCQTCGKRGCYLEAHHIKGWTNYPQLRYEVKNGVALCKNCHILTRKKY